MADLALEVLPARIALVHEWFTPSSVGGAEQVVQSIYNLLKDKGVTPELSALVDGESSRQGSWLQGKRIQASFIQKLPWGVSNVQKYLPFLPLAIEQLDVTDCPLVISSNNLVAKVIITSPDQLHISYVHTPVRYAWDQMHIYLRQSALSRSFLGPLIRANLHYLRQWDQLSASRVDKVIANSRFTARRISKYWGQKAEVIHPPVSVDRFNWNNPRDDFYLCVCRLVPYKRVDLLVQAFNLLKLPLLVVGDGPEFQNLKKLAGPTVTLLGRRSFEIVNDLMSRCRAFVYAGVEDFGISPVEAMASGAPVVAYARGGLLDTVRCAAVGHSSPTGALFHEQTVSSFVECLTWFEEGRIWKQLSAETIRTWAEQFSEEAFSDRFGTYLLRAWNDHDCSCNLDSFPFTSF